MACLNQSCEQKNLLSSASNSKGECGADDGFLSFLFSLRNAFSKKLLGSAVARSSLLPGNHLFRKWLTVFYWNIRSRLADPLNRLAQFNDQAAASLWGAACCLSFSRTVAEPLDGAIIGWYVELVRCAVLWLRLTCAARHIVLSYIFPFTETHGAFLAALTTFYSTAQSNTSTCLPLPATLIFVRGN